MKRIRIMWAKEKLNTLKDVLAQPDDADAFYVRFTRKK